MLKYIHNINAHVEDGVRYLTDVVRVKMEKVGEAFVVTAHPAVQVGVETIQTVPVHPDTESVALEVPVYDVPATVKRLVRAETVDLEQDTSNNPSNNWREEEVTVSPLVEESFVLESDAVRYYEAVAGQLAEGDQLRHLPVPGKELRVSYDAQHSRY